MSPLLWADSHVEMMPTNPPQKKLPGVCSVAYEILPLHTSPSLHRRPGSGKTWGALQS